MKYTFLVKSIELTHVTRKEVIRETIVDKADKKKKTDIVREEIKNVPAYAIACVPKEDTISAFMLYQERNGQPCACQVGQELEVIIK